MDRVEDDKKSAKRLVVFLPQSNDNNRSGLSVSRLGPNCVSPSQQTLEYDVNLRDASSTVSLLRHSRCDVCGYVGNCICGLTMLSSEWLVMGDGSLPNIYFYWNLLTDTAATW